jgi:hypothetical protein
MHELKPLVVTTEECSNRSFPTKLTVSEPI